LREAGFRLAGLRAWIFLRPLAIDVSPAFGNLTTMTEDLKEPEAPAIRIFVDADACPVKNEIYRVAERYGLKVFIVANSFMNVPRSDMIERVIVSEGPDVADGWIAERATANDIVITADIPLAGRCVRNGATVISPTGKPFDDNSIGMALATRDLMTDLRSAGAVTRGPPPLSRQDISRFLSALDLAVTRLKRKLNL
jgi:uncharacterized protein YaiI (UPF0178 family)